MDPLTQFFYKFYISASFQLICKILAAKTTGLSRKLQQWKKKTKEMNLTDQHACSFLSASTSVSVF